MTSTAWLVATPFAKEHFGKGKAEEAARMVVLVLEARGFEVSGDVRALIGACADLGQLETWATRAVTVERVDDLFV